MNFSLFFYLNLIFFPETKHRLKPRGRDFFLKSNHKNKPSHKRTPRKIRRQAFFKNRVASLTDATKDAKRSTDNHVLSTKTASSFLKPRLANNAWGTKAPYARTKQTHFVHSSQALASSSFQSQLTQSSFHNQLQKSAVVTKNPSAVSLSSEHS